MTHQVSLLGWRIEKRSNFGCTQSLVSRHSSLLTSGPRRSVKPGQRVDQGIGRMLQHRGDAAHECRYPAAGRPSSLRGGLIIATSEAASQHDRGSVKPPNVHGSSQNAYRTRPPVSSGQWVRNRPLPHHHLALLRRFQTGDKGRGGPHRRVSADSSGSSSRDPTRSYTAVEAFTRLKFSEPVVKARQGPPCPPPAARSAISRRLCRADLLDLATPGVRPPDSE